MLATSYNSYLVALSMLIASVASYVALDMAGRVTVASASHRKYWILASAGAMGTGIWSMHFVGMLALIVDVPVAYNVPLLALSIVVAIAGSAVTFFMTAGARHRVKELALASLFMGPAIAGMHYIGMAAMRMPARITYDPVLFALSVVIAILVSFVALQLTIRLRHQESGRGRWLRAGSAAVMGSAVYGMHYTGMLAARFDHTGAPVASSNWSILANQSLAAAVAVVTFVLLAIATLGAVADRRMRSRIAEADELTRTTDLLREMTEEAIVATDRDLRIKLWNTGATALLGWEQREMIGNFLHKIVPPIERDRGTTVVTSTSNTEQTRNAKAMYRHKNGSLVEVSVSRAVLRDDHNEPRGFVFLVADEAKRKRVEAGIRQSQKMEALGQLAGGVAHDFNNLLTAIVSYSAFLRDSLPADDPRQKDVRGIENAADRAAALTRQLLTFSRQEMIRQVELSVNEIIGELKPMLSRLLPTSIEVRTVLAADLGVVKADRSQLEQILLNLALNARDAMPQGGVLTITTANDSSSPASPTDSTARREFVKLTVSDTGSGMTPEVQARVFEPFFTTKPPGRGTGLGLATVHGIVTQDGGSVSLDSEPNRGTSITVRLPSVHGAIAKAAPAASRASPAGSETILLVEDDAMVRDVATRILRVNGYTVLEAATGDEAIAAYEANRSAVRLVITDMVMPGISGLDVVSSLRAINPNLRILLISGYSREALNRQDASVQPQEFLPKPFTAESLALKVREMLDAP